MREFDLNIEKVLENWSVAHALREIIANALDEQCITNTKEITIYQDGSTWHIRDYGRGLQYLHLTQNENEEKLSHPGLIGKFGVGLKDALATFDRHDLKVTIDSKYGHFSIGKSQKHGFDDIVTLHAYIDDPIDPNFEGTDFSIIGCSITEVTEAKNFFLAFANLERYEATPYGEIYKKRNNTSEIFINGIKVAEEENFLFSYNITSINSNLRKALNRERTNVGRSAYSERVRSILLNMQSDQVIAEFTENLTGMSSGKQCDEMKWVDVQTYAVKLLNARKETVFVTPEEIKSSGGSILEVVRDSGKKPVFVPETVKRKIENTTDTNGNKISTIQTVVEQYNNSFEYEFVQYDKLTNDEKEIYNLIPKILELLESKFNPDKILISQTLKKDLTNETVGLYEREKDRIIILRKQLGSRTSFLSTLIHELTHAASGYGDVSRGFESALTNITGDFATKILDMETSLEKFKQQEPSSERKKEDICTPNFDNAKISQMATSELEDALPDVDYSDGIMICKELLRRVPDNPDYLHTLACQYQDGGDYDKALETINQAILVEPNNGAFHIKKGDIYLSQKKYSQALEEVNFLKGINYSSGLLYDLEGLVYYYINELTKAIKCFEDGLVLFPDSLCLARNLISLLYSMENYSKAISITKFAIEHHPEEASLYFAKAIILLKQFKYAEAYPEIKHATDLEPNEPKYQQLLGSVGSMLPGGMNYSIF